MLGQTIKRISIQKEPFVLLLALLLCLHALPNSAAAQVGTLSGILAVREQAGEALDEIDPTGEIREQINKAAESSDIADLKDLADLMGEVDGASELKDLTAIVILMGALDPSPDLRSFGVDIHNLGNANMRDLSQAIDSSQILERPDDWLSDADNPKIFAELRDIVEKADLNDQTEQLDELENMVGEATDFLDLGNILTSIFDQFEDLGDITSLTDQLGDLGGFSDQIDQFTESGDFGGLDLSGGDSDGGDSGGGSGGSGDSGGSGSDSGGGSACSSCEECTQCVDDITEVHSNIKDHVTEEFEAYREWLVDEYFIEEIPEAMMLMANQLTTVALQQVQIIGSFFDAKHQLETQRLFQTLVAKAHKDYQPSEELCTIGTSVRSLASSERISDLTHTAIASRMMQRQLLSADVLSGKGRTSDRESRLKQFREVYCNPADNADGLNLLCGDGGETSQLNMDVDFTSAIESKLTLDLNLTTDPGEPTPDEENIFAMSANLFGHKVLSSVADRLLADGNSNPRDLTNFYVKQRAVAAKRSVAQNSFAAITAMRASGNNENAPFLKAIIKELGVSEDVIDSYIGASPSYFAQMEILTKKMYQNPKFYAELYDKPVNIERKGAALQAIALMQDRDIYNSLIRSEAVLATLLETLVRKEHDRISRDLRTLRLPGEGVVNE